MLTLIVLLLLLTIIMVIALLKKYFYISAFTNKITSVFLIVGVILFTLSMLFYPQISFEAAGSGVNLWFNRVLPALLPFFIGSELLINLGVIRFVGILLEPAMRPLFNVPGAGAFVFSMGLASGYPVGSMLTAKIRKDKLCTKVEAERLIAFCSTSGPLFIFGAVAVAMFNSVEVGRIIALSHYLGCLLIGFLFRFYKKASFDYGTRKKMHGIFKRAILETAKYQKGNLKPFGQILGDSVRHAVETIILIGGFIVFFAVVNKVLEALGIASLITKFFSFFLELFNLNADLAPALSTGLFEITLGVKAASASSASIMQQIIIATAIISWSGFSVQAQAASFISQTDISLKPYFIARFIHSIVSGFFAFIIIKYGFLKIPSTPVFKALPGHAPSIITTMFQSSSYFFFTFTLLVAAIFMFYCINLLIQLIKSIKASCC